MLPQTCHLVRGAFRLAALIAGLGVLSGCQAISTSTPQPRLRIIDVSPDAPALDIYEGPNALAYNLGFGTLTSYIPMPPSSYTLASNTTGTRQTLSTSKTPYLSAAQYTLLIGNSAASLRQLLLTDQSEAAPAGQVSLRFLHQATRIGPVDIYLVPAGQKLTAVTPVLTGIAFNANTGYRNLPAGLYTLVIMPAGTAPTPATAYTGARVAYSSGSARTILFIDQPLAATPGLQVITADDFDPPTANL